MSEDSPEFDPAELILLLEQMLDGNSDDADQARMNHLLSDSAAGRRYYARYMQMRALMFQDATGNRSAGAQDAIDLTTGGRAEAEVTPFTSDFGDGPDVETATAPAGGYAIENGLSSRDVVRRQAGVRRKSSSRTGVRLAWAAALLVAVGIAAYLLRPQPPQIAATITRSIDARWIGASAGDGGPIKGGRAFDLASGWVEFSFAAGGRVIVEGPARFTVDSPSALSLTSGKVAAQAAGGFTVHTAAAHVVDLGTEFGVIAEQDGSARVDLFKGSVRAEPRTGGAVGAPLLLAEGQAAQVSAGVGIMDPGGAAPQRYVRSLRDEAVDLDVADLMTGGDGTTARVGAGIDVVSGGSGALTPVGDVLGDGRYHPVPALPVVDGCFVPGSGATPMQVDSAGHQFAFPDTNHITAGHLWAGLPPGPAAPSWMLGGTDYSRPPHRLLSMDPNKAITLDLSAIRRLHPNRSVATFHAIAGSLTGAMMRRADVFVLVDGESRFERRRFSNADGGFGVNVPLNRVDRFLTLATTDGGDGTTGDRVIWADAKIGLSPR